MFLGRRINCFILTMAKLIILDRDGVINHDSPDFIKTPDEWIPISRSLAAISLLKRNAWDIAVATNQSGIARKLLTPLDLSSIHRKMQHQLKRYNAFIDLIVFCPHGPWEGCSCRKPQPGMYNRIAQYFSIPISEAIVVGDSPRDLWAADAVQALPYLVRTGNGANTAKTTDLPLSTVVFNDLFDVALYLSS